MNRRKVLEHKAVTTGCERDHISYSVLEIGSCSSLHVYHNGGKNTFIASKKWQRRPIWTKYQKHFARKSKQASKNSIFKKEFYRRTESHEPTENISNKKLPKLFGNAVTRRIQFCKVFHLASPLGSHNEEENQSKESKIPATRTKEIRHKTTTTVCYRNHMSFSVFQSAPGCKPTCESH